MTTMRSRLAARLIPNPSEFPGDPLQFWRERILAALLIGALIISTLALLPSLRMALTEGLWFLAWLDVAAVCSAGALLFLRKIPYTLRASVLLFITYIIAIGVITSVGIASGGPIWLFSFAVFAGVLMGLPAAFAALIINTLTIGLYGWLYATGTFHLPGPFFASTQKAAAGLTNFIFLDAVVSISVAVLVKGLQESANREKEAVDRLKRERGQLHQFQLELRQEIDQRKAAEEELTRQKGILSALHDIALGLIGRLEMNELLDAIVTQASSLIDSTNGFIYIYDPSKDLLEICAGTGVYRDELIGVALKPGGGLAGQAFQEGRTIVIDDYRNWAQRDPRPVYDDLRSAMAVPILVGDRIFGVLGLGMFGSDRLFGPEEETIMGLFAELVSLVIHNAQLYKDLNSELGIRRSTETALRERETQYKALYEESQRAGNVYRSLLHSSADAIVISGTDGCVSYVNRAFTQLFGWEPEEVIGGQIPFVPEAESEKTKTIMGALLLSGKPVRGFESQRLTKSGNLLDVSISASRYDDHEGQPMGKLCILRDISENRRLQTQFQQAQRLEAIGTLAGGVAHDFNNLLMGIQGNISLMQTVMDTGSPYLKHLETMESLVMRGSALTGQLLGFARAGKYEVKPTAINELTGMTADMFGRTKKEIRIEKQFEPNLPMVAVDRRQMEQVLLNIFVNAWQAMPNGGDLTIETGTVELTDIDTVGCNCGPGQYVYIASHDTGVGIPPSVQQRIFDPFFTTKEMGRSTGLGLASCYGIVQNHGGFIKVSSQEGVGSTLTVYLPVALAPKQPEPEVSPIKQKTGEETLLLVDDEPFVLDVGRQMLEKLGFRVKAVSDGHQAIDLFKQEHASIDAVILDMIMPGISGGETFDQLWTISPGVKVLLSSGYSINGQAEEILNRGCRGFIQKPFSMETLSTKIREVLLDD